MGRAGTVLALVAVAALASAACKGKSSSAPPASDDAAPPAVAAPWQSTAIAIANLGVRSVAPAQRCRVDEAALTRALTTQLGAAAGFYRRDEVVPAGVVVAPAEIKAGITYEVIADGEELSIIAAVEIVVDWQAGGGVGFMARVVVERILSGDHGEELCEAVVVHVANALSAAGSELIDKDGLRTGPAEVVVAALSSRDEDTQIWALTLVRERKLGAGFDNVLALVDADTRDVRETAVGALIALGDERAVPVLAKKAEMSDYEFLRLVIEAVSAIGGEEALSFLEFVASGHPDEDIRGRAKRGLERIDKKSSRQRE